MELAENQSFLFSDLTLARRLERTEAHGNLTFVETRARLFPDSGARWKEVAGAYAMYDGVKSPLTQTFGLGIFQAVTRTDLETIEQFFRERGAPVFHEISPLADPTLLPLLNERGYHAIEFTSVMFRPINHDLQLTGSHNRRVQVRLAQDGEEEIWAQTSARGWSEFPEYRDVILELAQIGAKKEGGLSFMASLDGVPIATGAMSICEGVALMAGASTVPEARKNGAQLALLESRLQYAAKQGCDIAMMCALPGSASQRNAERQGFRIAYTRIKWLLTEPTG